MFNPVYRVTIVLEKWDGDPAEEAHELDVKEVDSYASEEKARECYRKLVEKIS